MVSTRCPCCGGKMADTGIVVSLEHNRIILGWLDAPIELTATETDLAHILVKASPRIVSTSFIIERMWGASEPAYAVNGTKVYVYRLRKKLARFGVVIEAERSRGYRLLARPELAHVA